MILELAQIFRPGQDFSADIEIPALIHTGGPFHQGQLAVGQLQAGDRARMDTGTGIVIEAAGFHGKDRTVGVACYQNLFPADGPGVHALFGTILSGVVFRSTGRIIDPGKLQWLPQVAYHPSRSSPELIVQKVRLVPVNQMQIRTSVLPADDQPLGKDRRQKRKTVSGDRKEPLCGFCPVVIAPEKKETACRLEIRQQLKNIAVNLADIRISAILPELIAIPQLDIGEVIAAVILQRGHIQGLVP